MAKRSRKVDQYTVSVLSGNKSKKNDQALAWLQKLFDTSSNQKKFYTTFPGETESIEYEARISNFAIINCCDLDINIIATAGELLSVNVPVLLFVNKKKNEYYYENECIKVVDKKSIRITLDKIYKDDKEVVRF